MTESVIKAAAQLGMFAAQNPVMFVTAQVVVSVTCAWFAYTAFRMAFSEGGNQ